MGGFFKVFRPAFSVWSLTSPNGRSERTSLAWLRAHGSRLMGASPINRWTRVLRPAHLRQFNVMSSTLIRRFFKVFRPAFKIMEDFDSPCRTQCFSPATIFNIARPFLSNVSFQAKEKTPYAEVISFIVLLSIPDSLSNWPRYLESTVYPAIWSIAIL